MAISNKMLSRMQYTLILELLNRKNIRPKRKSIIKEVSEYFPRIAEK